MEHPASFAASGVSALGIGRPQRGPASLVSDQRICIRVQKHADVPGVAQIRSVHERCGAIVVLVIHPRPVQQKKSNRAGIQSCGRAPKGVLPPPSRALTSAPLASSSLTFSRGPDLTGNSGVSSVCRSRELTSKPRSWSGTNSGLRYLRRSPQRNQDSRCNPQSFLSKKAPCR